MDVTIFRAGPEEGYRFLEEPYRVNIISCAAVAYPKTDQLEKGGHRYTNRLDRYRMTDRVQSILAAAQEMETDVLLLSAFGCGAFGNPPEEVAEIFREQIETTNIETIIFAILNDHNSQWGSKTDPETGEQITINNLSCFQREMAPLAIYTSEEVLYRYRNDGEKANILHMMVQANGHPKEFAQGMIEKVNQLGGKCRAEMNI